MDDDVEIKKYNKRVKNIARLIVFLMVVGAIIILAWMMSKGQCYTYNHTIYSESGDFIDVCHYYRGEGMYMRCDNHSAIHAGTLVVDSVCTG